MKPSECLKNSDAMIHQHQAVRSLLITARDAAKALSIGQRKLWELTNRREIPHVRIGRAVRYDPRDLEQWIATQKHGVRSQRT